MIKQFVRDTGIYGVSSLITKGISFFLLPFYTRVLTPNDYGIMDIIAVFGSIVAVTVPLEITQAVARFLADKKSNLHSDNQNIVLVSSIGLFITLATFTLFLIIGLSFKGWLVTVLLDDVSQTPIVSVALLHMFFTGMFYFVQNQLRWTLKAKKVAVLSVLYTILNISFTIFFVLIQQVGVIGVFYAHIIAGMLSFLLGFYFSRENYTLLFSISMAKEMLRFSLPLVPSSVGVFFINYGQRLIIRGLMSLSDLGLFGVGSRISSIINMGFQSIQGAIMPLIYQNAEKEGTPKNLANIFRFISFALLAFFVAISLFSKELLVLLTTPAYYPAHTLVPFLILSESIGGLERSFTPGMAIKKRTDIIAYINIFGALFALAISFALIFVWGILGAAIAVLIKSAVIFVVKLFYSQNYYPIPYPWKQILICLGFALLLVYLGGKVSADRVFVLITFKTLIIIAFLFISVLFVKIITVGEIVMVYKKVIKKSKN